MSVIFMCLCNAAYLVLLLILLAEYWARGETQYLMLTFLCPMLWGIETAWEDMCMLDLSGDEKMVNVCITALGMRVPWEGFRFIFPMHYLARFACLENARGWQRNRLFTLKQIESFLSLFPQAIVQVRVGWQR